MDLKVVEYKGKFYIHYNNYGKMHNDTIRKIIYPMHITENAKRREAAEKLRWQTDLGDYIVYDTQEEAQKFIDYFCAICVEIKLC